MTVPAPETLRHFLTVLTDFDSDVLMPLLSPDPTLEFPYAPDGVPRLVHGPDDVSAFLASMRRSFVELHAYDITTHAMVDDGLALATWRSEGTTAGRPRPYRNDYVSLARVRDGLIECYREYFDPMESLRAFDHRL